MGGCASALMSARHLSQGGDPPEPPRLVQVDEDQVVVGAAGDEVVAALPQAAASAFAFATIWWA